MKILVLELSDIFIDENEINEYVQNILLETNVKHNTYIEFNQVHKYIVLKETVNYVINNVLVKYYPSINNVMSDGIFIDKYYVFNSHDCRIITRMVDSFSMLMQSVIKTYDKIENSYVDVIVTDNNIIAHFII